MSLASGEVLLGIHSPERTHLSHAGFFLIVGISYYHKSAIGLLLQL